MLRTLSDILQEARQGVRCIGAKQATAEQFQNQGLIIDVREPSEHLASPATGAINIPRGLLEMKILEIEKDHHRPIYLHCATSARALLAAEQLQRVGYENVTVITCDLKSIQQACSLQHQDG